MLEAMDIVSIMARINIRPPQIKLISCLLHRAFDLLNHVETSKTASNYCALQVTCSQWKSSGLIHLYYQSQRLSVYIVTETGAIP